ncbi:C-type mannose receptor 2 [Hyalella azteca]|uniref:C-type mannose receptor 2 n=1 Tax=Hyalella azteca TaxID=294128 RepID=A0A8B7NVN9_HYAAZ|nr:C-type mannose receptor 2 [Hyalella azteca]
MRAAFGTLLATACLVTVRIGGVGGVMLGSVLAYKVKLQASDLAGNVVNTTYPNMTLVRCAAVASSQKDSTFCLTASRDCIVTNAVIPPYYNNSDGNGFHSSTTHANDGYWLGATNSSDTHVWQWSDGSAVQMGAPYWAFDAGLGADVEPVGGPGENCAYIDPNSGWLFRDGPCSPAGTFHSVCSRTPVDGECTSQYVLVGTQCIHILTFYYHWEDARSRCALAGGDLIILDDCEQFRQIYLYLVELEDVPDGFWIGGSDLAQEGQWLWIDGSPMAMGRPYWANSGVGAPEPNNPGVENCLELSSIWMYRFSNTLCSDSRRVICETDPL